MRPRMRTSEIVAALAIIAFIVVLAVYGVYPDLRQGPKTECIENYKQMTTSLSLYMGDNAGTFPLAENWCDALNDGSYVNDVTKFACPEAQPTEAELNAMKLDQKRPMIPVGYSLYLPIAGGLSAELTKSERTPLFFDSTQTMRNSTADLDKLCFRHLGRTANIAYMDGHVESLTEAPELPKMLFRKGGGEGTEEGAEEGDTSQGTGVFPPTGEGSPMPGGDGHNHG